MKRGKRGFTLVELTLAMSVTLVIGLAVTGVAVALSNLSQHSEEYHQQLQTSRVASTRLQDALRRARLITAGSSTCLVTWAEDQEDPGQINLSEVVAIYRDPVTRELIERSTIFPPAMDESLRGALDHTVPLADMANSSIADGAAEFPQYDLKRVLARNVREFNVRYDVAPPMSQLVKFRLVVGDNDAAMRICGAARLRAARVGDVGEADGTYVLVPPPTDGSGE